MSRTVTIGELFMVLGVWACLSIAFVYFGWFDVSPRLEAQRIWVVLCFCANAWCISRVSA